MDDQTWIVHQADLPAYLATALANYDEEVDHYMHNENEEHMNTRRSDRGGARKKRKQEKNAEIPPTPPYQQPLFTHITFQQPEKGYMILLLLAHAPDMVTPIWVTPRARTWELRQFVAEFYETDIHDVMLSTFLRPLNAAEDLQNMGGKVILVHLLRHQGEPGYFTPFMASWRGTERDIMNTQSQVTYPRGGRNGQDVHDPRTAMMTFAIDRIQKEYPELPIATAKFLLRAEARTLTSVLNAKNPGQVRQVLEAAQKRAEIPTRATTSSTQQGQPGEDLQLLMQHQAAMISAMYQMHTQQPSAQQLQTAFDRLESLMDRQTRPIEHIKEDMKRIEERMNRWEEVYFPNLTPVRPAPPATPTEVGDQDLEMHGEEEEENNQPSPPSTIPAESQEFSRPASELIQRFEDRSLRQQRERAVGTGSALRPFGGRS